MWEDIKFGLAVVTVIGTAIYYRWYMTKTACYAAIDEYVSFQKEVEKFKKEQH